MKRIAGLLVTLGLVLLAIGPVAAVQLPVASLDPKTGPAGTEITVTVSQYSPGIVIEVHEVNGSGALIGTGLTNASGVGAFPITIPAFAPTGSYLLYICGLCTSEYPEWATRGFQVTSSPGTTSSTTTTTVAATTTTGVATTTTVAAVSTTVASASTTVAATTATAAATSTTTTIAAVSADDGGVSSRGLLVGLLAVLLAVVAFFVGFLVRSPKAVGPPPPPPPPAA
jgi:hypothetical protein